MWCDAHTCTCTGAIAVCLCVHIHVDGEVVGDARWLQKCGDGYHINIAEEVTVWRE